MQKNLAQKFSETIAGKSFKEFASLRTVIMCGLLAAIAVILGYMATINIGPYIKIGFSGIPNRVVDFLFGPVVGGVFGGMLDILKFIIKPDGTFFPGFTFDAMLGGVIYGAFLYRKKVKLWRVALACLLVKLIVNCGFNTLWISMLYGKGFLVLLPARLLKNLIMWPVDTAIFMVTLTAVERTVKPMLKRGVSQ
ncbi:MAG: folate family ECF transporter S component [Lachnospiraceae bacterium]|nr:folate family ECF transporter S component [Lachnospiraceae bacterium]